jgi:hypothetical protein
MRHMLTLLQLISLFMLSSPQDRATILCKIEILDDLVACLLATSMMALGDDDGTDDKRE